MMVVHNRKQAEAGYVMVTVAAMLVILVGFTALAIDTGLLFADRAQSQRAADAGALAGALELVVNPAGGQTAAENQARAVTVTNKVMGVAINSSEVAVDVDLVNRQVKVTITRSEPTFFAKVLGSAFKTVTTRVEAIAEAATAPTQAQCLKPFFIPNTAFADKAVPAPPSTCLDKLNNPRPCDLPCDTYGNPTQTLCEDTNYLLVDPTTHNPTPFGQTMKGQSFALKPQDPASALSPSQFYLIDVNGCGKTCYRDAIQYCASTPFICKDSYNVLTGNVVGPTRDGVRGLIGDPPRDTYVGLGQYSSASGISSTSKALVMAPIWNPCTTTDFCPSGKMSGTSVPPVQIIGFAMVFIDSVDNSDEAVNAHLIDILPCGDVTGDLDGSTSFAIPIRLVRLPQ